MSLKNKLLLLAMGIVTTVKIIDSIKLLRNRSN